MKRVKPKRGKGTAMAWAGFSEGHIHSTLEHFTDADFLALYSTRDSARIFYEDVRRVRITPVRSKRK